MMTQTLDFSLQWVTVILLQSSVLWQVPISHCVDRDLLTYQRIYRYVGVIIYCLQAETFVDKLTSALSYGVP